MALHTWNVCMLVSEEALFMCVRFMLSTLAGLQQRLHLHEENMQSSSPLSSKRTHKNFWCCPACTLTTDLFTVDPFDSLVPCRRLIEKMGHQISLEKLCLISEKPFSISLPSPSINHVGNWVFPGLTSEIVGVSIHAIAWNFPPIWSSSLSVHCFISWKRSHSDKGCPVLA